jgi:Domain of unknown function (DUF4105)
VKTIVGRLGRWIWLGIVALLGTWATAALYFDLPWASLRTPAAALCAIAMAGGLIAFKGRWPSIAISWGAGVCVLVWWLSLKPSNQRAWQPDAAQTAWAESNGDQITIHNFRDCDYRSEGDYSARWESRSYDLSQLQAVDLFLSYWGSPWIAHPIVSFDFGAQGHVAISVEPRKEVGKVYSAVRGFFRYNELIYVVGDERDVVRLRSNYRGHEDVYLFRTRVTPQQGRLLFLDYLRHANHLRDHPEWFNALNNNCTTNIPFAGAESGQRNWSRWDWRILLNGHVDEMLYEHGDLAGSLPFALLKRRALINPAAGAADHAPEFCDRIRAGREGFAGQERNNRP